MVYIGELMEALIWHASEGRLDFAEICGNLLFLV